MSKHNGHTDRKQLLLSSGLSVPSATQEYHIKPGRLVRYTRTDSQRAHVTDSPTAAKFVSLLNNVDSGSTYAMHQLHEEMVAKDAHLQGVWNTRVNAIAALDWEIVPAQVSDKDQKLADDAADFVRQTLESLESFEDTLVHLLASIATGVAITELVWKELRLVDLTDVPFDRIEQDLNTGRFTVETPKFQDGIPVVDNGKFITRLPKKSASKGFRITLTRAQAWLYLIKHFVLADWAGFSERFGMPIPVVYCDDEIEPDVKDEIDTMLSNLAANGYARLPNGATLNLMEANRSSQPYKELLEMIDRKTSILYLGQNLTTELPAGGSYAAANVHNNVRADILLSDLKAEAHSLKFGLFAPICALRYPNRTVPLPSFRRILIESRNVESERLNLEQAKTAWEFGLPIGEDDLYDMLGITKPVGDIPVVRPSKSNISTTSMTASTVEFAELRRLLDKAIESHDEEVINAVRGQIGSRLNTELKHVTFKDGEHLESVSLDSDSVDDSVDPLKLSRERWGSAQEKEVVRGNGKQ